MAQRRFVAFDMGAESGRAVVGRLGEGKLVLEEKYRFANPMGRMNGHLHWDVLAQWGHLKAGLTAAAADGGPVDGIGIDTWGVDYGLLDEKGELLGLPYNYRDRRTDGVMDQTFARVSRHDIFDATGIQFMQLNTLFQLIAHHQHQPKLLEAARTMLFMPDLFNYLFTGVQKSEYSVATTSQMYDPRRRGWAIPLIEALGLPTHILPQIVPSGTILGDLRGDVADECGVGGIPVIAPACHDTGSAVAAVPAEGPSIGGDHGNWCYISSGTWSLMGVELDQPVINEKSLAYNYTNEGGVGGSIRFLKNIMGLWLVQECRRAWISEGREHGYGELTEMARQAQPLRSIVNPDDPPFLSPGDMPRKIAEFCRKTGQPVPENPGQFVRACLDSLALTYRATLEGLEHVLDRKIEVIHIVGGGTQNELLNQMTADACGRLVVAGPVEATGIGNILVQAMAVGQIKSLSDARAVVRNSFPVKRYEPAATGQWDPAYDQFTRIRQKA